MLASRCGWGRKGVEEYMEIYKVLLEMGIREVVKRRGGLKPE
jgi:hypothetical protein